MWLRIFSKALILFVGLTVYTFQLNASSVENTDLQTDFFSPSAIQQIHVESTENSLEFDWFLSYDAYIFLKENDFTIAIRYLEKDEYIKKEKKWNYLPPISIDETSYTLNNLPDNEKFYFQIGINKDNEYRWSSVSNVRTEASWGWFKLFVLIGSLGLFVHGLKSMGEGLQQNLGSRLRSQLSSIASNRLRDVVAGFSITVIVQSIIASILMIVSFVNAGLLSLTQSAGVMLGAGIGAAATTWFINLLAFEINLSAYALFILAFSAPLWFFGKQRWKPWVNTIFGFVFLILGLGFMIANLPDDLLQFQFIELLIDWSKTPVVGPIIFAVIGLLIAIFLQSTVATIALAMALMYSSNLPFEAAISMLLGANLGTAINVEFASRMGNVHAKRSARLHSIFSGISFIWAILLFPVIIHTVQWFMMNMGWGDPISKTAIVGNTGLAIFHTLYALANVTFMVWFIPAIVQLVQKNVKSKGRSDEVFHLEYINSGILSTADLSILEAKKEIAKFGNLTLRMSKMTRSLLYEKNTPEFEAILARIKKYEDITDRIEIEVVQYLNKLSDGDLTLQTASRIHSMNSMANDLERIGDIFYQMSKTIERKAAEKLWFTPEQRNEISKLFDLVDHALTIMCENLLEHHDKVRLDEALEAERKINEKRNELRKSYLENLSNQDTNFKAGMIYNDLFSSLEKVGDHVINVSEAVVGKL